MTTFIRLVLITFFLVTPLAHALTIMEINTEFLWDDDGENEGQVVDNVITSKIYKAEVKYWVSLIKNNNADIVGLVEIEGCHIAKDISDSLGDDWQHICKKGRDNYTGQDVAILTTMSFSGVNNFKDYYSMNGGKRVRPSKVVGATLNEGGSTYFVVAAHLISMAGNNDAKRLHQAKAIVKGINALRGEANHLVVLGDLNSKKGTPPLIELLKTGLYEPSDKHDCSYMYKKKCNLIDYILVSDGLTGGNFEDISIPAVYSDHQSIIYTVELE